ncbi:carbohydrate ABC transporter permease [Spirochaeta cellobiosiphila]|uniref:carbohydrate ABC transporter permease n=1 Tax=Spirochaeta cellobiosiphila TaxID=504483 RepID=UPI0003F9B49F|nr:carbohydrate ABC transporter permease [Spirochaeta cellobiosiphila]
MLVKKDLSYKLFKYSLATLLGVVWFVPLFWLVITAFKDKTAALNLFQFHFTLKNFVSVSQGAPFFQYFMNSIFIAGTIFCVQVITMTFGAYAFARLRFWGKEILFLLFLVQIIIPNEVLIVPNYLTIRDLHLIDTKLAIMLPFLGTSLGIFLLRQTIKSIPMDMEEAARLDGCGTLRILWHVIMPLSKPAYVAFGLVSISYHWNDFLWPLIVTNSVHNRPMTVGLAIYAMSAETGAKWAETCSATLLVVAPLIILFIVFQKQFINSFIKTGIK